MPGRATLTLTAGTGKNAQVIMQGHAGPANGTSFTARIIRNFTANIQGRSGSVFASRQIQNAAAAIIGHASLQSTPLAPVPLNATVSILGRATNQIAFIQVVGRATGLFSATSMGLPLITITGRSNFAPRGRLLNNSRDSFNGRATGLFLANIAGQAIPVFAQVFIAGGASGIYHGVQINNAQVGIFAGNPVKIPVFASILIGGHVTLALSPKQINNAQVQVAGHVTGPFIATITGTTLNNAALQILSRASLSAITPTIPVNFTARLAGNAALLAPATVIRINEGVVSILGRATAPFQAFVVGSVFNNGIVSIAGRSGLVVSPRQSQNATVSFAATSTSTSFQARLLQRAIVSMAGSASLISRTPHQSLVWISGNTLQYKVWQYNMESTVRVLGTTWTVQSVGLSFQSIALELVMTEAGWGN